MAGAVRNIPFLSFKATSDELREEALQCFADFWDEGYYVLGNGLADFEKNFAAYLGAKHVVGVGSGFDALTIALKVLDIGAGDEVIVPSNTYIATALSVIHAGATPVFAEPNVQTANSQAANLAQLITPKTKAIIPVHLYGQSCEMGAIKDIALNFHLDIIEDNAQAVGATYFGVKTGSFGKLSAQSFYPTKNLGAVGDGGAISTSNATLYKKLISYRNYGFVQRYVSEVQGVNSRLDELQARLLNMKLAKLDAWIAERQRLGALYNKLLAGISGIELPTIAEGCNHTYHLYVIKTNRRNSLKTHLEENGIQTIVHYPVPPYKQPALKYLDLAPGKYPIADALADRSLSLPLYPGLSDEDVNYICTHIKQYFGA